VVLRRHALRFLVAASLVGAITALTPTSAFTRLGAAVNPAPVTHSNANAPAVEADMFARLNHERLARHLRPLVWDTKLAASARAWSAVMSRSNMHHSNINVLFQGRFDEVAENIAWASGPGATAGAVHLMWMRSADHRENMVAPKLDRVGIGVFCANGTLWATQQFGQLITSGPAVAIHAAALNPIVRPDPGSTTC
jgi:uncharacterized protein YkwD